MRSKVAFVGSTFVTQRRQFLARVRQCREFCRAERIESLSLQTSLYQSSYKLAVAGVAGSRRWVRVSGGVGGGARVACQMAASVSCRRLSQTHLCPVRRRRLQLRPGTEAVSGRFEPARLVPPHVEAVIATSPRRRPVAAPWRALCKRRQLAAVRGAPLA